MPPSSQLQLLDSHYTSSEAVGLSFERVSGWIVQMESDTVRTGPDNPATTSAAMYQLQIHSHSAGWLNLVLKRALAARAIHVVGSSKPSGTAV